MDKLSQTGILVELDYSPFGSVLVGRSWSAGSQYRYGFNGQEQDDEVYGDGNLNTAEFWEYDSRLGRRWNVDLYHQFSSPYLAFNNNPIIFVDPSGAWVPGVDGEGNITLTAEENDDFNTLVEFFKNNYESGKLTQDQLNILGKTVSNYINGQEEGKESFAGLSINLTTSLGGVYQEMSTAIIESRERNNPTTFEILVGSTSPKNTSENYNCWGTCIAINEGKKLEGKGESWNGVGIPFGLMFDNLLETNYTPSDQAHAIVGSTVMRWDYQTGNVIDECDHGAIYMGTDSQGNQYVFSKNGWVSQPAIFKTTSIDILPHYGKVTGINAGESGYYNFNN